MQHPIKLEKHPYEHDRDLQTRQDFRTAHCMGHNSFHDFISYRRGCGALYLQLEGAGTRYPNCGGSPEAWASVWATIVCSLIAATRRRDGSNISSPSVAHWPLRVGRSPGWPLIACITRTLIEKATHTLLRTEVSGRIWVGSSPASQCTINPQNSCPMCATFAKACFTCGSVSGTGFP